MRQVLLQRATAFFITKCDGLLLQSATAFLLQSATRVITKCDSTDLAISMIICKETDGKFGAMILAIKEKLILTFN